MRLINIGREPQNIHDQPQFDDTLNRGNKRKKVRIKPAWEVWPGPIAKELANGDGA